jgi:hypothetical protein
MGWTDAKRREAYRFGDEMIVDAAGKYFLSKKPIGFPSLMRRSSPSYGLLDIR